MRYMFLVILWWFAAALGFAQQTEPAESPQTESPITAVQKKPPPLIQYFQGAKKNAVRNDFILSTLSFIWNTEQQGLDEEMFTIHWSFLPFTSLGAGLNLHGLFGNFAFPQFAGFTAQGGLVIPITQKIKIFGDFLLEMGCSTASEIEFALNLGYDVGFTLLLDKDFGIEIKYKGIPSSQNPYRNALGIGWLWNFWL